jgi:hypothetical protein
VEGLLLLATTFSKVLVQTSSGLQHMCCSLVPCSAHLLMDFVAHVDNTICHELWNDRLQPQPTAMRQLNYKEKNKHADSK